MWWYIFDKYYWRPNLFFPVLWKNNWHRSHIAWWLIYLWCEMITTVGLVNIRLLKIKVNSLFLLVMKPLRIYSLNNIPIYHTAVLAIGIMLYITTLVLTYLTTASLYLLTTFLQFPLSLTCCLWEPQVWSLLSYSMNSDFLKIPRVKS